MRIVIATTTGFHLRHLAVAFKAARLDLQYISTLPRFRLRRDGIGDRWSTSLFTPLLPGSAAALFRPWPALQNRAVQAMLVAADDYLAPRVPPCDVFIGLSAMAVKSAEAARRQYGATIIIERGSRHVLSQHALLTAAGGGLGQDYIYRELASYAAADFVALPSGHAVESFVERGFPRERLLQHMLGVDLERFRPTPRPEGPTRLLFVGAWSRRKGADILGEAMRRRPALHLTHVGMPGDVAFPDLPNVTRIGHRTHAELVSVMARHHTLVLPSREDGFGMVLLEALAAGLPVVASSMTGAPDIAEVIAGPYVGLARPGDVDDLVRALDAMAAVERAAPADRRRLTDRERQSFGWDAYADRYRTTLEPIVAARPHPVATPGSVDA